MSVALFQRLSSLGLLHLAAGCTAINPAYGKGGGTGGADASTTGHGGSTTEASTGADLPGTSAPGDDNSGTSADRTSGSDSSGAEPEALCGNGVLDQGEECDDGNVQPQDGCTGKCFFPASCLEILEAHPGAADGDYLIDPDGGGLLDVYCDMISDGGGYTFYRVDLERAVQTVVAEDICADVGMRLWIPRSPDHLQRGCSLGDPSRFMRILGVYPSAAGAQCGNQPLHSGNPDCFWVAGDGGPFWVHNSTSHSEPNGSASVDASAWYDWEDCTITFMDDQVGQDTTTGFYCDVGDKWGER